MLVEVMKVHPELEVLHKTATCCKGDVGCCCQNDHTLADHVCLVYVSCGPGVKCGKPCRHCLSWEGYGGEETIKAIKGI